jgi:hypothetical protein
VGRSRRLHRALPLRDAARHDAGVDPHHEPPGGGRPARENGLSESFGDKLSTEITNIAGLPTLAARKRIKRDAKKGRRSWGARASVLCALGGAMAAGPPLLYDLIVHHHAGADDVAQNGAIGCATGVTAPPLYKWAKAKGFTLEDE